MGKIIARFGPSGQADGICGMHRGRSPAPADQNTFPSQPAGFSLTGFNGADSNQGNGHSISSNGDDDIPVARRGGIRDDNGRRRR
jgi:hypothetical protein